MKINLQFNNYNYNKSKQSFSGRQEIREKSSLFADDIIEVATDRKLNKKELEKVMRAHIPAIVVRPSKGDEPYAISCSPYISFLHRDNSYRLKSQTIRVPKLHQRSGKGEKAEFIDSIVHEMTHAFQHLDDDISFIPRYNAYLKNNSLLKLQQLSSISEDLFVYVENKAIYPIIADMYEKAGEIDISDVSTSKELLKKLSPNAKKRINSIFKAGLKTANKKLEGENMEFVLNDFKNNALAEEDAYRAGAEAGKKFTHQDGLDVADAIPELYRTLAEIVK